MAGLIESAQVRGALPSQPTKKPLYIPDGRMVRVCVQDLQLLYPINDLNI
jgi:hypothetical protein